MKILKKNTLLLFIILITIIISYFNFVLQGGFGTGDDIGLVLNAKNNNLGYLNDKISFFNMIKSSFLGKHPDRPLSIFISELTHYFYKDNIRLYIISSILTWLLTVYFLSLVLLEFLKRKTVYIFLLLAPFPFFSSTIITGPYLFTAYFTSILFWSISLFCLVQYAKYKNIYLFVFGLFFLIFSLLCLEYIIPLLLLTIFFPILYEINKINLLKKELFINLFFRYFLPVIIISLFFLIFKIFLVKLYTNTLTTYGVSTFNIKSFLQASYYFFVILIEVPLLLFEAIGFILKYKLFLFFLSLLIFIFFIFNNKLNNDNKIQNKLNIKNEKFFLLVLIISLLSSAIIFFISVYPSSTFGYYNKMMVPSFVSLTIIISIYLGKINMKRYLFVPIFISILWIFSMFIQLDNSIKSWEIRVKIIEDISSKLKKIKINKNFTLIANVPFFLKDNYNNETVFFTTWNFNAHLKMVSSLNLSVWPISHRILTDPLFYPGHNIINKFYSISDNSDIYYYQFEEGGDQSIIEKLGNKSNILKKFELIKVEKINNHQIIMRENIRLKLINLIQENFNLR